MFIYVLLGKNIGRQTATRIHEQIDQYKIICNEHELMGAKSTKSGENENLNNCCGKNMKVKEETQNAVFIRNNRPKLDSQQVAN